MKNNLTIAVLLYYFDRHLFDIQYNSLKLINADIKYYLKDINNEFDKNIDIKKISGNMGECYNKIIDNCRTKYLIILDSYDLLDPTVINDIDFTKNYQIIKFTKYKQLNKLNECSIIIEDQWSNDKADLINKLLSAKITPRLFGSIIFNLEFINNHNIRFLNQDLYNDIIPYYFILLNIDINNCKFIDKLSYTRVTPDISMFNEANIKYDYLNYLNIAVKHGIQKHKLLLNSLEFFNYCMHRSGDITKILLDKKIIIENFFDIKFNDIIEIYKINPYNEDNSKFQSDIF